MKKREIVWNNIKESFNSRKLMTGCISGLESVIVEDKQVECVIVFCGPVKVYIPYTELGIANIQALFEKTQNEERDLEDKITLKKVLRNMVGAEIDFVITGYTEESDVAQGNREEALKIRKALDFDKKKVGDQVLARVVEIGKNHVLAEVYGVHTIVYINEVAWGRIYDIKDHVRAGEKQPAVITEKADGSIKISFKQAKANPYKELILDKKVFVDGGEYEAVVRQVKNFGIFVEFKLGNQLSGITALCNYPDWQGFSPVVGKNMYVRIKRIRVDGRKDERIDGVILREL